MPLLEWSDDYSVGVGELDAHHRKLLDLLNKLHDAMLSGKAKSVIGEILRELTDYTVYHFQEEEKLMEKVEYSELEEHKKAHRKFIVSVGEYNILADKGLEAFLSSGISNFLGDWLKTHIGGMDKKYQKEMNAGGIR